MTVPVVMVDLERAQRECVREFYAEERGGPPPESEFMVIDVRKAKRQRRAAR